MFGEELPDQDGGVDFVSGRAGPPFGHGLGAGPGVASAVDGLENHVGIGSAVGIGETVDARRDARFDRSSRALISLRGMGGPVRNIGKRAGSDRG
jgi:hypothetical protein